ncbi:cyclase family protein [Actinospica robiniae]|uniref:cyclase family protein n=1 Tax=Actinospica robiniae TaxID=304901 RepID=UPI00054D2FE7|nr:cyclase family protein [Actinospica robiniae]
MSDDDQWRVQFDAAVTFANGGALQAQDFRLDAAGPQITAAAVGELFVRHLGLLMVDRVDISNMLMLREAHKGSRATAGAEHRRTRAIVDLSHVIRQGMVTYPGLPGPQIGDHLSREASRDHYEPGTEFSINSISMVANTGTYVDSPFHRFAGGADLAALPLSRLTDVDGVVVRTVGSSERAIERGVFLPYDVAGKAVLIHTGWDRNWGTERYGSGHPFLSADAAKWLAEQQPALVGIDSLNIDDTDDGTRPAHTALLDAGIPIVEHLRGLEQLPAYGFRFHAAPLAVEGMGTFPVRACALIGEEH